MRWSGEVHTKDHCNTQNTEAEGVVTGARYIAGQEFGTTFQDIPPGTTFTFEFHLHMIRPGETGSLAGDDYMQHMLAHFTVNAKGVPTVSNIDLRAECK